MSLRISEKVIVVPYPRASTEHCAARKATIVDFLWGEILVKYEDGDTDWVDNRRVRTYG